MAAAAAASGFAACFPRQIAEPCTAFNSGAAARFRVRFGSRPLRIEGLAYGRRRISLNPRCSMNVESSEQSNNGVSSSNSGLSPLEMLKTSATDRYTKERSSIIVIGLNIHTAPVELREKFSIPEAQWPQAISELCALNHIEEAAVLSTCNRMEIYVEALSQHRGVKEVTEWMSKTSGVPIAELCKHRVLLYNENATQHLFEVASGLDSLVLGECQILSQVKQVVTIGQGVSGFGMKIGGLFKHAISVGKRVRDQTKISSGSVSVSSAAVQLALTKLMEPLFANTRVSVIGAGDMGKLLIKHLVSKGCEKITIVNRTEERVAQIIKEFKGIEIVYKPISELQMSISEADIVFACTKSEAPLLTKEQALQILPQKTRIFIDISVPRNIDSRISDLETAQVFDVDDLKQVVSANMEERDREAEKARAIVSGEVRIFEAWKDSRESVPTIRKFSAYVERIRAAELDKCLARMGGDVSEKDKKAIYDLSMGIANKLRRGPMEHLRSDGGARCMSEVLENVRALNRMFDLHTESLVLEEKIRSKVKQKQKN